MLTLGQLVIKHRLLLNYPSLPINIPIQMLNIFMILRFHEFL